MMIEATSPSASRMEFMKLVSSPVNITSSELDCVMDSPAFSPYGDAHCVDNDDWKEFD